MTDRLGALTAAGVSIWLDDMSRERVRSGNLAELIEKFHVSGVTSNPSIFAKAISGSDLYTDQLRTLKGSGADVEAALTAVTTDDIRDACDLFAPQFAATAGEDGRASIEVDPRLAHEVEATVAQAKSLRATVDRDNVYIKIPATRAGLAAIADTIAVGININVTLIFSVERYAEVLDAYLAGLERARAAGLDLSRIHSVASVFVSRTDVEVDKRLEAIGTDEALALRGKAALAVSWLCHEVYAHVSSSDRWRALAAAGAHAQRPLWASTSTKNPAYRDVLYVEELVTANCVNTMPEPTMHAFADHGQVRGDTVAGRYDDARALLESVRAVGVDFDGVFQTLEDEGVEKFITAWTDLIATTAKVLEAL